MHLFRCITLPVIILLICFSRAEGSSGTVDAVDDPDPAVPNAGSSSSNNAGKSVHAVNDPESDGANVGSSSSNNPGQSSRRYGRDNLTVDEMVKSDAPAFESDYQKDIRKLYIDRQKYMIVSTPEERAAATAQWFDDYTCQYGETIYHAKYCNTLMDIMAPTYDFASILTVGMIDINGTTATVHVHGHGVGRVPLLGSDVDIYANWEMVFVRQDDGEWKLSHRQMIDDNSNGVLGAIQGKLQTVIRDSIYSAKQQYPAYNPFIIVTGSAITGFLALAVFGIWILRKRRSYRKIHTVSDV